MEALGSHLFSYSSIVLLIVPETVFCSGYYYNEPWGHLNNEAHHYHDLTPQHQYDLPPHHARILPRELMVDVINNLALTLLEVHNQHNDNNMALSPYGATSVLVALAEGLLGDAAREVIQAGNIPGDLAAVRVGLRDIHRHLKSYFIPKEGFLAGLTLNNENVTLNPEYEHILRFYGYDINSFNTVFYPEGTSKTLIETTTQQISITSQTATTQTPPAISTTPEAKITIIIMTTEKGTTSIIDESTEIVTSLKPERTTRMVDDDSGTIGVNVIESRDNGGAEIKSTTPTGLKITKKHRNEISTKKLKVVTMAYESTENITLAETRYPTSILYSTTEMNEKTRETTTEVVNSTATEASKMKSIQADVPVTSATAKINSISTNPSITIEEITTTFVPARTKPMTQTEPDQIVISSTESIAQTPLVSEISTNIIDIISPGFYATSDFSASTIPSDSSNVLYTDYNVGPTYDTSLDYNAMADPSTTSDDKSSTPNYEAFATDTSELTTVNPVFNNGGDFNITAGLADPLNSTQSKRSTRSIVDYIIAKYYDNYDFGQHQRRQHFMPPPQQTDYQPEPPLTFLVNGHVRESNINFMTFDTILPFYFVRALNALALSFPLDSAKYYLLLVLPVEPDGIDRLICNFKQATTLKGIIENLKYTHVKAIIPSFNLRGYVILTPTFQKIGIRKIFEPRQADFSQMTTEKDIYVTNIEQAITVTIRNYVDPNNLPQNGKLRNYRPVDFVADHPFLYFVMDSEIHVSLMAGKVLNPLNSRIR